MPYSSVATSLVTVIHPRIPSTVLWHEMSGGKLTHATQEFPVGPRQMKVFRTKSERENIETKAHADPVAHAGFIKALNTGDVFEDAVVKVVSVDSAGVPIGEPDTYTGCMVTGYVPRQVNNGGEDMQVIPVEWKVPAP